MPEHPKFCHRVLIVEDDREIRELLQQLLEWEGYEACTACNGKEALELLPKMDSPCLILLDLMMPVMDGWEFMKEKEGIQNIAPIPVVIVSAVVDRERPPSKAKAFVKKPIEVDALLKIVEDCCA